MQGNQVKLSVIVPVYNVKDYLPRCLDSIVNQTLKGVEIVVVDDGSTDGCADIVDEYALRYSNIVAIHKENGGLMSAWTTGVRASKGDYIGFVDSDDYVLPEMYEKLLSLASNNDADMVISNYLVNGTELRKHPLEDGLYTGERLDIMIKEHIFPNPCQYSISMSRMPKLFRKNIISDNLKYTESLSRTFEDRYIVPATILSTKSIYYTASGYYCWILREGSNRGMYKDKLLDDIKRVYDVQQQVVSDKYPSLEEKWEELFLDFIRLYVDRNLIRVKNLYTKIKSAKVLLNDPLAKERIDKYGDLMTDKLLRTVKLSHRLHCPLILALASYLVSSKD